MALRILTALPVYNEVNHVRPVLEEVRKYSEHILVVNDGSSDGTAAVLAQLPGINVVTHPRNQGYGAALRSAFEYSLTQGYDVLVTIDCDGQHQPELIPDLANSLFADAIEWDIVSGSRYLREFEGDSVPPADRRHINFMITKALNERLGLRLTDTFCGFKAYRVPALRFFQITEVGYAMPLQLWVQAVAHGLRITEYPVPLIYLDETRSFGGSLDDAKRRLAHYREVINRELSAMSFPTLDALECSAGGCS